MKLELLKPHLEEKIEFSLKSLKFVPELAGCYVLSTFSNDILYIGLSENLRTRFKKHVNDPGKTNSTNEGRVIWFHYMLYSSSDLKKLERTWLNQFSISEGRRPILNKIDSPVS